MPTITKPVEQEILALLQQGKRGPAVKLYHGAVGCSLRYAVEAVTALEQTLKDTTMQKKTGRHVTTNDALIERYLGTESPTTFDSEEEIKDYFSPENLTRMFGPEDFGDAEAAELAVFKEWRGSRRRDAGAEKPAVKVVQGTLKPEDFSSVSLRDAIAHLHAGDRLWVLRTSTGEGDVFAADQPWAEIQDKLYMSQAEVKEAGWTLAPVGPENVRPLLGKTAKTRRAAEDSTTALTDVVPKADAADDKTEPATKAETHQYGAASAKLTKQVGPALAEIFSEFGPEIYNGVVTSVKGALKTAFEAGLQQVEETVRSELGNQGLQVAQQYYRVWLDELTSDLKQHGFDDAAVAVEDIASDLAAAFPSEQAEDADVPDLAPMQPADEAVEEDVMPVDELPDLEPVELEQPAETAPAAPAPMAPAAPAPGAAGGPVDLLAPTADLEFPAPRRSVRKPARTPR
jgi:hypothetical protein